MFILRYRTFFTTTFILLFMSSCINITEYCEFGRNGKGTMRLEVKLSYLKMFEEEKNQLKSLDSFDTIRKDLEQLPNISQVDINFDQESYTYTFQFEFDHIKSLNRALSLLYLEDDSRVFPFFVWDKEQITRQYPDDFANHFSEKWKRYATDPFERNYQQSIQIDHHYEFRNSIALIYSPAQATIQGDKNRNAHVYLPFTQLMSKPDNRFTFVLK